MKIESLCDKDIFHFWLMVTAEYYSSIFLKKNLVKYLCLFKKSICSNGLGKYSIRSKSGKRQDLGHFRIFDKLIMAHVPKERRFKWDKESKNIVFSENIKDYSVSDFRKNIRSQGEIYLTYQVHMLQIMLIAY